MAEVEEKPAAAAAVPTPSVRNAMTAESVTASIKDDERYEDDENVIQFIAIGDTWGNVLAWWFLNGKKPFEGTPNAAEGKKVIELIPRLFAAAPNKIWPGETQALQFGENQIYAVLEGGKATLIAACMILGHDYPQRIASNMLFDCFVLARQLNMDVQAETGQPKDYSNECQPVLQALAKKYDDPIAVDKIHKSLMKVNVIKAEMRDTINSMLSQMESLKACREMAVELSEEAKEYSAQTKELNSYFWWKDCMMCVAITFGVLVVLGIIGVIVWKAMG